MHRSNGTLQTKSNLGSWRRMCLEQKRSQASRSIKLVSDSLGPTSWMTVVSRCHCATPTKSGTNQPNQKGEVVRLPLFSILWLRGASYWEASHGTTIKCAMSVRTTPPMLAHMTFLRSIGSFGAPSSEPSTICPSFSNWPWTPMGRTQKKQSHQQMTKTTIKPTLQQQSTAVRHK